MPARVLLLLSQVPHDPGSGAARSMHTICEFLAAEGMEVQVLATTATEAAAGLEAASFHHACADMRIEPCPGFPEAEVLRFTDRGMSYQLFRTDGFDPADWERPFGPAFDALLEDCLHQFRPDILFTFGGSPAERARRARAQCTGCKVVFGLRNLSYLFHGSFENVDAVLTGSRFVSERYRQTLGIDSTPLPLPLNTADVVAATKEQVFITYVNPSPEKGVFFAARLFEELACRRPDIPVLVVESRGTGGTLIAAGRAGSVEAPGFDLQRHESIMLSRAVTKPADIFSVARVVIMPSVWEEPAGRVAAEALANGIPPVVSSRGGLPEVCGEGGFVLPLPESVIKNPNLPVPPHCVEPWLELLMRLVDDDDDYAQACHRAATAGAAYDAKCLSPRYAEFFRVVLKGRIPPPRATQP
jgi:glycosyltransferase involved in cell wall biosynthesis